MTPKEFLQNKYPQMRGGKWDSNETIDDNWVAQMMQEYKDQEFSLHVVSGMLPTKYDELPEKLKEQLFKRHRHAELVDGEKIVYKEQDVLELLKYVSEGNYR